MSEYPKALYADGGDELVWGEPIRTIIAHDEDEELILREDGWRLHPFKNPLDHDENGKAGGSMPARKRK